MMKLLLCCILIISVLQHVVITDDFDEFVDPDDTSTVDLDRAYQNNKRNGVPVDKKQESGSESATKQMKPTPADSVEKQQATDDRTMSLDSTDKMVPDEEQEDQQSVHTWEKKQDSDDTEAIVSNEADDFKDPDEFEGIKSDRGSRTENLTIVKVPHHLTTSWDNYYLEMLMVAGLILYLLNYLVGKAKNGRLANAWLTAHKELLESNFSFIGDDGSTGSNSAKLLASGGSGCFNKDAEHIYSLWCSGRVCCEGMLVELKLLKRQDIVSTISRWMKPATDQITCRITLDDGEMEGFVLALIQKKKVQTMLKEYTDLVNFCPERKMPKQGIPESFAMLSEIGEATSILIDNTVCKFFREFEDNIEYMHISDQYSGPRLPQDDQQSQTKLPETKKTLSFGFKVGKKGTTSVHDMENILPLFKFVFYMLDKIKRVRLTKEAKLKSDKNRAKAMESQEKMVHSQRQEAAQQRREEKRRQEKDRLMAEEDPDKARRLEVLDQKKEAKRKQPKIKMLKVKGM